MRIIGTSGMSMLEKAQFVSLCLLLVLVILFALAVGMSFVPLFETLSVYLFVGSTLLLIVVGVFCVILHLIDLIWG